MEIQVLLVILVLSILLSNYFFFKTCRRDLGVNSEIFQLFPIWKYIANLMKKIGMNMRVFLHHSAEVCEVCQPLC